MKEIGALMNFTIIVITCRHCYKFCWFCYKNVSIPFFVLFFAHCVIEAFNSFCSVVQDAPGDTALHDAIGRRNDDIINMLIACNDTNFKLKNQKGFNVLHEAARCGDVKSVIITLCSPFSYLHSRHRLQKDRKQRVTVLNFARLLPFKLVAN